MLPFWNFGVLPPGPAVFEHFKMGYNLELFVKHSVRVSVVSLLANRESMKAL
jgi:hypothetical protein